MTVADGSLVRLAYVAEATIGTTPANPSFKILRYRNSDAKISKQTETPDEVRPDGNATAPIDVGQTSGGTLSCLLSYGVYDDLLSGLFRKDWATNVLVNGIAHKAFTFEETFEMGPTDSFLRYPGIRVNTAEIVFEAKKSVQINLGVKGLEAPAPGTAILSGATYAAASEEEVFNSAINVADLEITGIANSPVIKKLNLRINSNVYDIDAVSRRGTYAHGLGRFEVEGSFTALFENQDTYAAILAHTTVGLSIPIEDAAGNSYLIEVPKMKLMDGAPAKPGNNREVTLDVPFRGFYDSGIGGTMKITRTPA